MKARLVKGPFAGRVVDYTGDPILKMSGPKKMTRKQKFEHSMDQMNKYGYYGGYTGGPRVEAEYRIAYRVHSSGSVWQDNVTVVNLPCMHPDGSIFYEYVEGSRREI